MLQEFFFFNSKWLPDTNVYFLLLLLVHPSMWQTRHGKSENPRRSERLEREGGRGPEPGIQEEGKEPAWRKLWKDKREGLKSSKTLLFEISRVKQEAAKIRARCGSERGWPEWNKGEGPWKRGGRRF